MTQEEFEAKIIEAISNDGDLFTSGDENGVAIDGHGPTDGNKTTIEGWYRHDAGKAYFAATITVTLDDYAPNYDDEA